MKITKQFFGNPEMADEIIEYQFHVDNQLKLVASYDADTDELYAVIKKNGKIKSSAESVEWIDLIDTLILLTETQGSGYIPDPFRIHLGMPKASES